MYLLRKTISYLTREQRKRTTNEIILIILLSSILMLFLPLVIILLMAKTSGLYSHWNIPNVFGLSTLIILCSSRALHYAKKLKEQDRCRLFKLMLLLTIALGTAFLFLQFFGWKQVFNNLNNRYTNIISVIVLFHGLHFFIGLLLLTIILLRLIKVKSGAEHYIYFLHPGRNMFFKTIEIYWDYLGILWAALYTLILIKFI